MCSCFLKGCTLRLYVIGQCKAPERKEGESDDAYAICFEDWDGSNHQIITWLRNTSTPSVHKESGGYNTPKEVWGMLASRYSGSDGAREHNLMVALYQLRQEPGQHITAFHSPMYFLYDQLAISEPIIKTPSEAKVINAHHEMVQLHQSMMRIHHEFESVRSQLLHLTPLPSVNKAVNELGCEDVYLLSPHSSHIPLPTILAILASITTIDTSFTMSHGPSQSKKNGNKRFNKNNVICKFYKAKGHTMEQCHIRVRIL